MLDLKQPVLGIVATAIVIAIALGFVSLFDFPTFSGWVAYSLLCMIPMEIVVGVTWATKHPAFAQRNQPAKGILLVLTTLAAGAIVEVAYFSIAGGRVSPPAPMLIMCTIVSVVITFWGAIMWGGWPFTALIGNPVLAGLAMLVACYGVNYLFFRLFFSYDFMAGAPVYVAALDPHGLFNAWNALVYYMSSIGVMFVMLSFDLWPLTKFPAVMKQPMLGIVWTLVILVVGAIAMYIGVGVLGMDAVAYMVRVPVPYIFGTIVVLNMLQGSLFAKHNQPVKGILNFIAVAIIGTALAQMYGILAPAVTGKLNPGPPAYEFEIWLASALLSVTFPFLIFYAEFFKMWPLTKAQESPAT